MTQPTDVYPSPTKQLTDMRRTLAPAQIDAFRAFAQAVFADGALDARTKQLIAVAVAHATQCPYCIRSHTKTAMQKGATPEQVMEAIWVASEMSAGAAYAHALLALDEVAQASPPRDGGARA
jgi:AhpD family alkylhydroperoxidase